ncbi:MAG: hypothetical protein EOO14_03705 [Chitinophagaceae bacterium]|nr:MAG: hypothetical protein EOO14_03705 [Chitinophagaceae bacterium]
MQTIDWNQPQRQPAAGLLISFLNGLWQLVKQFWLFFLIIIIRRGTSYAHWPEYIGGLLFLSFAYSALRFFYFRFFIEADQLIVKSGWLQKKTTAIPLGNIQSVEITQGPAHQVLSLVKLTIDTAGSKKEEATIDALRKPMAEALRERLLQNRVEEGAESIQKPAKESPFIQLTDKDLFKLSLSANHLKAFFLFIAFASGLYDKFSDDNSSLIRSLKFLFPGNNIYPFLFLLIAVLLITVLVSSADIFLRFHEFSIFKRENGFYIRSGLFQVKERMVAMQKVQFISWQASWLRKKLGLWLLEYHVAGADEANLKTKIRVPVTQQSNLPMLVAGYHPLPSIASETAIRIHPAYISRRFLLVGLLPALLFMLFVFQKWDFYTLLVLLYPAFILLVAWLRQRKFRLWALDDVLYLKRGTLGEEGMLLQWHKLQFAEIRQSIYQRKKGLATVVIHTAGGAMYVPYIPLAAARQLVNFALYKTESTTRRFL